MVESREALCIEKDNDAVALPKTKNRVYGKLYIFQVKLPLHSIYLYTCLLIFYCASIFCVATKDIFLLKSPDDLPTAQLLLQMELAL